MAEHLMDITCGDTTYYVSYSGEDVYRASTSGSRGDGFVALPGLKFYKNAIVKTDTGKLATEADICMAIAKTL